MFDYSFSLGIKLPAELLKMLEGFFEEHSGFWPEKLPPKFNFAAECIFCAFAKSLLFIFVTFFVL